MSKNGILIENGTVITVNDAGEVHQSGYVLLNGDRIEAVGAGAAPAEVRERVAQVINAQNMAVLPGMGNCHTHLFQSFIRGLADDRPLLDWLKVAIWPVAEHMTAEEGYWAGLLGMLENLRSGATMVIDHQYIHRDPLIDDGVYKAASQLGMRLLLARGWADMNYHPTLQETPERVIAEGARLYETYHGKDDGRLRFEFGPLIPWGCSDDLMRKTYELSRRWGTGTHIHVAETRTEVEMNLKDRGTRHIEWLAELGILGPDVQLVHSVWLDDHELELVAQHGAVIVHCPVSNMYLASGSARIRDMLKMGIPVALATDGPGSNNNQDLLEVLKTAALLAKVSTLDAMAVLPGDILRMACRGGALAYGQPQWLGSLEAGKKADVVLVDLDSPFAMPVHDARSALVYNLPASAVDTVIVDGRVLMQGKEVLVVDEKAVLAEARRVCRALFEKAGVPY